MGLAVHPDYYASTPKKYVYVAYIKDFVANNSSTGRGWRFRTAIVRFTMQGGQLANPQVLVDTIPGGDDHNSGRLIIAPEGGVDYLFYAVGDMGAGQFGGIGRENKAQTDTCYEGKILRFNLEPDADPIAFDKWIPNDNPYNRLVGGSPRQSAIWCVGMRNNQGFAYANINGVDRLYGQSHGPFTDDELNLIERKKNYGHPIVVGMNDGNYNGARAGQIVYDVDPSAGGVNNVNSTLPIIVNENTNVNTINAIFTDYYRDPIYTFYDTIRGSTGIANSVQYIYNNTSNAYNVNDPWPSEGTSGLGIYTYNRIPGWKNSILIGTLKRGRILRVKLNAAGTAIVPTGTGFNADTVSYFNSRNKFRDMAVDTNGREFYTCIDVSAATSGPGQSNPIVSACQGCILKYTFLGYNKVGAPMKSSISSTVSIANPTPNGCVANPNVTITANNEALWAPITDINGDIIAEVLAKPGGAGFNTANLGVFTSSVYRNTNTVRIANSKRYLDRNITLTPGTQPNGNVKVRIYLSGAEFTNLNTASGGGLVVSGLRILKNNDACGAAIASTTSLVTPDYVDPFGTGYVIGITINSFSSFYIGTQLITLPVNLLSFSGTLADNSTELRWETSGEHDLLRYAVERSVDGTEFTEIGSIGASGATANHTYVYSDLGVSQLTAPAVYYRLKMIDIDGNSKYSSVISFSLVSATSRVTVLPNPVGDVAHVAISAEKSGTIQWKLIDNAGRTILNSTLTVQQGKNTMNINTTRLKSGLYYLSVTGAGIDQKVKVRK